jgi:hypothetical protein
LVNVAWPVVAQASPGEYWAKAREEERRRKKEERSKS